jgi:formate-dependent nitrite reductase cytochrome c552 subunit
MKKSGFKISWLGLLTLLFIIFSALAVHSSGQDGVIQTIKNATAPFNDEEGVGAVLMITEKKVPVQTRYRTEPFWTETRKDKIQRFECSQCHNNKSVTIGRAAAMAHGKIVLVHGGQDKPLSCYTCHNKDERDFLVTEEGSKIDMDHSYQMCGQCHFRQKKDWVGGAHGKRISYWAGQRVIKNCTSCHDPHSPRFEKRWPKTYSPLYSK